MSVKTIHHMHALIASVAARTRQPIENLDRDLAAAVADGGSAEVAAAWGQYPGLQDVVDALRAYAG